MRLERLHVQGYRSLRDVTIALERCTVVVGANGVGKTNLYRAMQLVTRAAATGGLGRAIAHEGGMESLRWAGARKKGESGVVIHLGFDDLTYQISLTVPNKHGFGFETRFDRDPVVTAESIKVGEGRRAVALVERGGASCMLADENGRRVTHGGVLVESESVLSQIVDMRAYPLLATVRALFERFRFYHAFRTDLEAPIREPRVATRTPILADTGDDLAAAIVTIEEIGHRDTFREHVARAFGGARVEVESTSDGRFGVTMAMPGVHRPLVARELSDGTLRYLCLLAALLSPHPPPVLVLNEPETSLHPDLLLALVPPIVDATARSQVVILTHSIPFAEALATATPCARVALERVNGATVARMETA